MNPVQDPRKTEEMPAPDTSLVVFKTGAETETAAIAARWPARLFRAGEYPDKAVTITRTDLDGIIARFNAAADRGETVPVKTEHRDTPLDPLGEIVALWREEDCLYALFAFSEHMAAHLSERRVQFVSAAFLREPTGGFVLTEASLVFTPRVPDAAFLRRAEKADQGAGQLIFTDSDSDPLDRWRRAGKVTPAMEKPLRRLLAAPVVIGFTDGDSVNIAAEVAALLDALPPLLPRGAAVPASGISLPGGSYPADVAAIAARFGLPPEKVAARM
jgi:hypothetical protein